MFEMICRVFKIAGNSRRKIVAGIVCNILKSFFNGFMMFGVFWILLHLDGLSPAIIGQAFGVILGSVLGRFFFQWMYDRIKDVSLKIPSGSITALVGPSGSGKSTISKLIARFWDVQKGPITIGGENIKNIEPEHLMKSISFVFQDVTLFNDTVYNNIRVGNMAATEEQVMAAAKAAYCDEFVMRLSDGYQTVLGENGSTLSGGERQRISIARALLKDAPIILLDEATASLDPENEVLIQRAIARLVEGKTVIMIAHRLRTVVDADQIFVLENGKLVERGTHDELIAHKGLYEKLYHIQQESLDWVV